MDDEIRLQISLEMLKEVIERDIEIPLKTFGLSMRPVICDGEWIGVRRAAQGEIRIGDIIVYQAGSRFVAHRAIRRMEKGGQTCFQLKGDAHLASEGVLPAGQIVARVVTLRKQNRIIDMEQPAWRRANRIIAHYSSAIDRVYRCFPYRPERTSLAGRLLAAAVRLPPRLLMLACESLTKSRRPDRHGASTNAQ